MVKKTLFRDVKKIETLPVLQTAMSVSILGGETKSLDASVSKFLTSITQTYKNLNRWAYASWEIFYHLPFSNFVYRENQQEC